RDRHQADDFLLVEELRPHLARQVLEGRGDSRDINGEAARSGWWRDHSEWVTLPENLCDPRACAARLNREGESAARAYCPAEAFRHSAGRALLQGYGARVRRTACNAVCARPPQRGTHIHEASLSCLGHTWRLH